MPGETQRRERKVVTVVFCDLVGFTSQAEAMDPEDVEALLTPYHDRVRTDSGSGRSARVCAMSDESRRHQLSMRCRHPGLTSLSILLGGRCARAGWR